MLGVVFPRRFVPRFRRGGGDREVFPFPSGSRFCGASVGAGRAPGSGRCPTPGQPVLRAVEEQRQRPGSVPWEVFPRKCSLGSVPRLQDQLLSRDAAGWPQGSHRERLGLGGSALPLPLGFQSGGIRFPGVVVAPQVFGGSEPSHTRLPRGRNTQECRESQQSMCSPCSQGAGRALGDTFALSGAC